MLGNAGNVPCDAGRLTRWRLGNDRETGGSRSRRAGRLRRVAGAQQAENRSGDSATTAVKFAWLINARAAADADGLSDAAADIICADPQNPGQARNSVYSPIATNPAPAA